MKLTIHRKLIVALAVVSGVNVACDCLASQAYLPKHGFNRDASANFVGYAGFATAWLADFNQPEFSCVYDSDSDGVINMEDLEISADGKHYGLRKSGAQNGGKKTQNGLPKYGVKYILRKMV